MSWAGSEWLQLLTRWLHVVAGVFWVGQTALFVWLDRRLTLEARPDGTEQVWMVHSGGFYVVERQRTPELLPRTLHWFRWEAALTWLSGVFLLALVYYHGEIVVEPESALGPGAAAVLGLGVLGAGWVAYDLLWISPLALRREGLATLLSAAGLAAAAWGLSQVMTGRSAYLHVGGIMGTVMAFNVWVRILPGQRQMVAALKAGRRPDLALGERAKQRSKHNTFLAIPLLFLMVSSHYPSATYGQRHNWAVLVGLIAAGFAARGLVNRVESR